MRFRCRRCRRCRRVARITFESRVLIRMGTSALCCDGLLRVRNAPRCLLSHEHTREFARRKAGAVPKAPRRLLPKREHLKRLRPQSFKQSLQNPKDPKLRLPIPQIISHATLFDCVVNNLEAMCRLSRACPTRGQERGGAKRQAGGLVPRSPSTALRQTLSTAPSDVERLTTRAALKTARFEWSK